MEKKKLDPTGIKIGQRLFYAFIGEEVRSAKDIEDIVYSEMLYIAREQELGDWIEMPDGATYVMTFKPRKR